jgi:hypothetical protein
MSVAIDWDMQMMTCVFIVVKKNSLEAWRFSIKSLFSLTSSKMESRVLYCMRGKFDDVCRVRSSMYCMYMYSYQGPIFKLLVLDSYVRHVSPAWVLVSSFLFSRVIAKRTRTKKPEVRRQVLLRRKKACSKYSEYINTYIHFCVQALVPT